jgi:hypothetical protein
MEFIDYMIEEGIQELKDRPTHQRIDINKSPIPSLRYLLVQMGGLKIMLSGSEPLLHPLIWEFLEYLRSTSLRVVMLSNDTLIDEDITLRLKGFVLKIICGTWINWTVPNALLSSKTATAVAGT